MVLPENTIKIFDPKKVVEDEAKHANVYHHLDSEATTLKGVS